MGLEIERKFLLANDSWKQKCDNGIIIKQGYLSSVPERTVRIRLKAEKGILTVKGKTKGVSRVEYEYEIPYSDAVALMELCEKPIIEKTRFNIKQDELTWEVDVFTGENKGLIVAEIELQNETEQFDLPSWVGVEVSEDPRYYNANLIKQPYCSWVK
jgi:adenylate cyclase